MVLVGHSQRLAEPLSSRQKRALATVGAILVLASVGVAAWLATHSNSELAASRNGCVNVIIPAATGGQALHYCGSAARAFCRTEHAIHNEIAQTVDVQCRLAGVERPRSSRTATQ
ncbi:MAG: hypothetical protein ABSG64_01685 [Solirubrobacteraceae bacterium]|jgi:hypothetical protein